jgi:hypothetical protein
MRESPSSVSTNTEGVEGTSQSAEQPPQGSPIYIYEQYTHTYMRVLKKKKLQQAHSQERIKTNTFQAELKKKIKSNQIKKEKNR